MIDMQEAAEDLEHLQWYVDLWDEFSTGKLNSNKMDEFSLGRQNSNQMDESEDESTQSG